MLKSIIYVNNNNHIYISTDVYKSTLFTMIIPASIKSRSVPVRSQITAQPAITWSKLLTETLEGVKYVQS